MRDTARLENGRVVYDRRVIMARAWKRARREFAAMRDAERFPLLGEFDKALREVWAEAKQVAWGLKPVRLSRQDRLELEAIGIEGADRPQASDFRRLGEIRRELASLQIAA